MTVKPLAFQSARYEFVTWLSDNGHFRWINDKVCWHGSTAVICSDSPTVVASHPCSSCSLVNCVWRPLNGCKMTFCLVTFDLLLTIRDFVAEWICIQVNVHRFSALFVLRVRFFYFWILMKTRKNLFPIFNTCRPMN